MRFMSVGAAVAVVLFPSGASAQCFNRNICGDPSVLEIRSQISVNVPIAEQASSADAMKTMEDARRDLYTLSNRECETLRSTFGGECTLSGVNLNSSIQERGIRGNTAFISISNTYQIKRPSK